MTPLASDIDVSTEDGKPRRVHWHGRTWTVEHVADCWVIESKWWLEPERRVYYRLNTSGLTVEIYRSGKRWHLCRVLD